MNNAKDQEKVENKIDLEANSKLFLLSKGLTTDTLEREFLNLLEKEPQLNSVAVIVNASSTIQKKYKKTEKVKIQFTKMGFDSTKIELFDLMKTSHRELSRFDIIYILGGNPFLLLNEVNKSGAHKTLESLMFKDKILMGYSAGSLLLGPNLSLMNHVDSLLGFNEINLKELSCIGLYDFYIFPHYTEFTSQVPELAAKIENFESLSDKPLHRLNDNQGIIIQNGNMEIIGN
ncbi:Type 1 glutamine amidotransferase-like domain-containing protein [Marinigracilibium pacificum]|nr:Type 1 glutamine amidotransferase-like domain-containing protein [Marinigracilibium pacificum]